MEVGIEREKEEWSEIFFLPKQQWKHEPRGRERRQMALACLNNNESEE
jgi:hypothetical protein